MYPQTAVHSRLSMLQADIQLLKKGHSKPGEMAEKAANVLMDCFRICAGDRYVRHLLLVLERK